MKMRKSTLSLAVSLLAVPLLFAGNVFAAGGDGSVTVESDSITPELIVTATCVGKHVSAATNDINSTTTSNVHATIPGMSVSIFIPGTVFNCLTVDYSAQAFAPGGVNGLMMVRAVLDGFVIGAPGEAQMVGGNPGVYSNSHNMQWLFTNVAPGFHTLTVQFRSVFAGFPVHVNKGIMTVHHR